MENAKPVEENSQDQLADLTARATAKYAIKEYEEAAELYSQASTIQAEINGEMSEENADLLFAYGRCLFYVAQKTSTVLGGTAATAQLKGNDKKPAKKRKVNGTAKPAVSTETKQTESTLPPITETSQPADVVPAEDAEPQASKPSTSNKPFFQIEGDAPDWDDSDEDEEEDENGEDEEEEDDFNTAYEILDLSRVLLLRKLESRRSLTDISEEQTADIRSIKVKISDVYDLQAEINLEGEKFPAAATDLRSCLALKEELYESDNALLAECHYKLSLALEAASQVQQRDSDGNPVGDITIDWDVRKEAVEQQAKAIESCRLRVANEKKVLEAFSSEETAKKQKSQEEIDDVEEMIEAMEQRLEELRKPPVSVKAETEKDAQQELMGSVLGQMLGAGTSDKEQQKAKLAEVIAGANDLSGMVKRKKPKAEVTPEAQPALNGNASGKRKIDEVEPEKPSTPDTEPTKKIKISDVID